ncbi:hypothetical protein [Bacteroides intestinalis]|jgi:hypothetical protein|uniref:Glycosyltransferase family 52 n=2 Tax=Bacteroides intestinalis TaxID=329854 RepID=A0A414L9W9_9BACE|nr:hypothetical protein DW712_11360 [Bacteroides intestinalis]
MLNNYYIAQTPYHLMTILNIIYGDINSDYTNVIILAHRSLKQFLPLCKNVKNTNTVFDEDLCLNYKVSSVFKAYLKIAGNMFLLKKRCERKHIFNEDVAHLFVPSDDIVCRVVYNIIKKNSPSVKLSLYDDANATYVGSFYRKLSILGGVFYWLFLDVNYRKKVRGIYCYNPQLIDGLDQNVETKKIAFHDEVKILMKSALNDQVDKYLGKKVVFLDQGIRDNNSLNQCLRLLEKYFSKDEVLVKLHPRIAGNINYNFDTIRDEIPFEIASSSLDFTNAITVTCYSGACVMSILMFGDNSAKAVFLQKICANDLKASKLVVFIKRVQNYYGQDKIFSPSSIDEFEMFLKENKRIEGVKELSSR